MRLAHDCNDGDPGRASNRFRNQLRQDIFLVVLRHGGDYGGQWRLRRKVVLLCDLAAQSIEIDVTLRFLWVVLGFVVLHQSTGDVRACSHESFIFWGELDIFRELVLRSMLCHGRCSHTGQSHSAQNNQ